MNNKKYRAPLIIGGLAILQLILIVAAINYFNLGLGWSLLLFVIFTVDNFILIYFVRERVNEIKGGEEDDLGKY